MWRHRRLLTAVHRRRHGATSTPAQPPPPPLPSYSVGAVLLATAAGSVVRARPVADQALPTDVAKVAEARPAADLVVVAQLYVILSARRAADEARLRAPSASAPDQNLHQRRRLPHDLALPVRRPRLLVFDVGVVDPPVKEPAAALEVVVTLDDLLALPAEVDAAGGAGLPPVNGQGATSVQAVAAGAQSVTADRRCRALGGEGEGRNCTRKPGRIIKTKQKEAYNVLHFFFAGRARATNGGVMGWLRHTCSGRLQGRCCSPSCCSPRPW